MPTNTNVTALKNTPNRTNESEPLKSIPLSTRIHQHGLPDTLPYRTAIVYLPYLALHLCRG